MIAISIDCCTLSRSRAGVALAADLGAHARQQLVLVDRAHQIVVHADLEPAQQPRIVLGLGDHQDRHAAGAVERAHLAAQPQPVEVLQSERDDQALVVGLRRMEQRFLRVRLDVDGVLGGENAGDALVGGLAVVDQQHAPACARSR